MKRKIEAMHRAFGIDTTHNCKECCNFIQDEYRGKTLRKQQEQPNEPLTLDELRKMDGNAVWCADTDGTYPGLLCYVECLLDDGKEAHIWLLDNEGNVGRYNVRCMIECGASFYRREPERAMEASEQFRAIKEELLTYRTIGTPEELKALLQEQTQREQWCDYCKDADSNPCSDLHADEEFSRDNKFYFCPNCGRKLDGGEKRE